jgi:fatty-acyl-CoA synthase
MVLRRAQELYPRKTVTTRTVDGLRTRTYAEVVGRAARLASALHEMGVRPGDRVATFGWNTDRHLEAYLAVPCMGAVLHTLNIRLHPDQLTYMANHAEDQIVLADASLADAWGKVENAKTVRDVVWMEDTADVPDGTRYEDLIAGGDDAFAWPEVDEHDAAAMCYTSGTTGSPKGVVYGHRSSMLHTMSCLYADSLALSEADVVMPIVPQFHANAWGTPYAALFSGASLAMPGAFMDPGSVADLVETAGVTISAAVPTVWFMVLEAIRQGSVDKGQLASLERLAIGGSAVPAALLRAYDDMGIRTIHAWGMTETSPLGSVASVRSTVPADDTERVRLSQGLVLPGLRARVVTEEGSPAAWDGETMGELQVTGPWIAEAYYDPEAEGNRGGLDRFDDATGSRWLRTGDVAVMDPDGYILLVDRTKDLIKSGGEWISSLDVENLLIGLDGVKEAAVIAVPDPKWDERPMACVVRGDPSLDEPAVKDYLAEHLAKWQIPDQVVFIDEVPKTSTGKFDKKVLRAQFSAS